MDISLARVDLSSSSHSFLPHLISLRPLFPALCFDMEQFLACAAAPLCPADTPVCLRGRSAVVWEEVCALTPPC